jgi:hypothetical protein
VSAPAAPLRFSPPEFIDEQLAGGEPVLMTDPVHQRLLYSTHAGTTHLYRPGAASGGTLDFVSTYRNQVFMWSSDDRGKTWQRIDYGGGFSTDPTKNQGFSDPDFTQDAGGRIYNTGIDLANQAIFSSADGGKTWDAGTAQCSPGDRPWLAGGRKDEVFLATNTLYGTPSHQIFQSTDGGRTCPSTGIPDGGGSGDESYTGNGKILYDRASDRLIEPVNFGSGGVGGIGVGVWNRGDEAFSPHLVAKSTMYAHWPAMAVDDAGTVYLVWDDDPRAQDTAGGCNGDATPTANHVFLASSTDFGETWSAPQAIAAPAGRRVLWPWIAAGEKGRVSVVWYETDKVVDLACESAAMSIKAASILRADEPGQRTIETVDAAGRPVSVGNICQSGTTCAATGEDRRLGDFFTNAVDLDGCVFIGSGDTTRVDPITGNPLITARPIVLHQTGGRRLRGTGDCDGTKEDPGADLGLPPSRTCTGRVITIRLQAPRGAKLRSARVTVGGRRARVLRRKGRLLARIDLRGRKAARYTVRITARTTTGRIVRSSRTFRTCKR